MTFDVALSKEISIPQDTQREGSESDDEMKNPNPVSWDFDSDENEQEIEVELIEMEEPQADHPLLGRSHSAATSMTSPFPKPNSFDRRLSLRQDHGGHTFILFFG